MRAYTLTVEDETGHNFVYGVVSSKKAAIDTINEYMKQIKHSDPFADEGWRKQDKHYGSASKGPFVLRYEMFFVNQVDFNINNV